ncbi:MAG: T9SS type A sorting domain-containing protein, partial [Dysgonamonadaceae bacterium]|nr:T9SS type A sorting domain-containing protein [Dysgonamonadaceae bacterium]
ITKDLEDAIICVNESHTFELGVEGEGLTYEWYYGNSRILGANTNRYTIVHARPTDYEKYYVIVWSNYNGYHASIYSKQVRLWVTEQLPETLQFETYPDPAFTGSTYHLKLAGYSDVTEYAWSYSKEDVTFSPETGVVGENETWATFGTLSEGTGTVTATLTHPCGTREATQTIRVTYPTGTEDVTDSQVAVYPNPTAEVIRISNTVSNQVVRITDVTGSQKWRYRTQEGVTTIDLTGYAKGTYLVHYDGKTYKVIKK